MYRSYGGGSSIGRFLVLILFSFLLFAGGLWQWSLGLIGFYLLYKIIKFGFEEDEKDRYAKKLQEEDDWSDNSGELKDDPDLEKFGSSRYGFVYFIRNKDLYKIGITKDLLNRMNRLNPDEILDSIRCKNYKGLEKEIHRKFKEERIPQTEYFRLNKNQVNSIHKMLVDKANR